MSKLAIVALVLGGCSVAFGPGARKPSVPALADTALAAGAIALGVSESEVTCPSSQFICLSGIDHAVGGVSIALGIALAVSAVYGYTHATDPADAPPAPLVDRASIAAHAGDCTTAADVAMQVHARGDGAYAHMLDDDVVQSCLLRGTDLQRRTALDAIAHAPNQIPLAAANGQP
jgi:hypothetical protein